MSEILHRLLIIRVCFVVALVSVAGVAIFSGLLTKLFYQPVECHTKVQQEDQNRPRCNRDKNNTDKCEKCKVVCDENGSRTVDKQCKNYCTEQKCDCDVSCNP